MLCVLLGLVLCLKICAPDVSQRGGTVYKLTGGEGRHNGIYDFIGYEREKESPPRGSPVNNGIL